MEINHNKLAELSAVLMARCEILEARRVQIAQADPLYLAAQVAHALTDPKEKLVALALIEASLPASIRDMKRMGFGTVGSVAIVPLVGSLQKDTDFWSNYSTYYSSTRYFSQSLRSASKTKGIKSAVIYADSPGGYVDGMAESGDVVAEIADSGFPVVTYASGMMASAAYRIGSQASAIYSDATADIGSVGVVLTHADYSEAMAKYGVKITHITSGEHKAAGSPYVPLTDATEAYLQNMVNASAAEFYAAVEAGRMKKKRMNNMSMEAFAEVKKAGVHSPKEALTLGLIDGIASLESVIAMLNKL
jgi:capsid assembly protease